MTAPPNNWYWPNPTRYCWASQTQYCWVRDSPIQTIWKEWMKRNILNSAGSICKRIFARHLKSTTIENALCSLPMWLNLPILPLNLLSHLLHASDMLHISLLCNFLQIGQIHLVTWKNTSCNLKKCNLNLLTHLLHAWMNFATWRNTFGKLDKYICQLGQIQLAIWTNTFGNLNK